MCDRDRNDDGKSKKGHGRFQYSKLYAIFFFDTDSNKKCDFELKAKGALDACYEIVRGRRRIV